MKIYDTRSKKKKKKSKSLITRAFACVDEASVLISLWLELELCE